MRYENSKLFSNSPCVVLMFTIGLPFSKTCLLANSLNPSLLFVVSCSRWHICDISQCHVYSCSCAAMHYENSKLFSSSPCVVLMFTIGLPFSKTCLLANSLIQAVQTWSNSNSIHVDVRHKTEQRFMTFLISGASCTCVRYVNQYTCHVRDVALLPFRQESDSSRTNLIE